MLLKEAAPCLVRRRYHVEQKSQTIFTPILPPFFFGKLHKSPGHLICANVSGLFVLSVCASASGQNEWPNRRAIFTKVRPPSFPKVRRQTKSNLRPIFGQTCFANLGFPYMSFFFGFVYPFLFFAILLTSGSREGLLNPNFSGKFFVLAGT